MNAAAPRAKVAFVTARFPFGPLEAFLDAEIRALAEHVDVTIVPSMRDGDAAIAEDLARLTVASMSPFSVVALLEGWREFCRAPLAVARALLASLRGPRGISAKLKNLAIFPKALAVARELRARGVEHVHAYWLSAPATIAFVVAELNGVTWSATGHRYDLVDFNLTSGGERPRAGFVARAEFVRTISQRGRAVALLALGEAFERRVHAVHLGVRMPSSQAPPVSRDGGLRLACVAQLVPVKGHDVLLRALALVKAHGARLRCDIIGAGPLRATLGDLARQLGIEDIVTFTGALPHDVLMGRFERGDYDGAILTSVDEGWLRCEGIPVCLMEAMAAGRPCIATDSGSVGELVDETNGILVLPGAPSEVADAIERLIADPSYRERMGASARRTIERGFSIGTTSRDVAGLLLRAARAPYGRGTF